MHGARERAAIETALAGRVQRSKPPEMAWACFVSISDNQRLPLPDARWCGTVHHGPANLFHFAGHAGMIDRDDLHPGVVQRFNNSLPDLFRLFDPD